MCLVMSAAGIADPFAGMLATILIGACLGFLAYNWHPAKIFLGDVGSVPLGYLAGFLLLVLALEGHWQPALIIPAYYLADSGITITRRALRGEKFWQSHRQHFYQRAAQRVGRHDKVVIWLIVANIALIVAALIAEINALAGTAMAVVVVVILLRKMYKA
jgi:UDP-N-acetylmuramyl pentapeptide phosphotransferase/UDP-N-acetylglucosamine-1-phosphate transferase